MENLDSIINAASEKAQSDDIAFDAALTSVLSDTPESLETEPDQTDATIETDSGASPDVPETNVSSGQINTKLLTVDHLSTLLGSLVPAHMDRVLSADAWTESGNSEFPYAYEISDAIFSACMRSDLYVQPVSTVDAIAAGIYPVTDTQNGRMQILAASIPQADLSVTIIVSPVR